MTSIEHRQATIEFVVELIRRDKQDRWLLTSHPALNGDWPALAMQKGNKEAVSRLLLRINQGH